MFASIDSNLSSTDFKSLQHTTLPDNETNYLIAVYA